MRCAQNTRRMPYPEHRGIGYRDVRFYEQWLAHPDQELSAVLDIALRDLATGYSNLDDHQR